MSKYDRNSDDVYAVKRLGDEIGYGHLMALAHELWARHLESKGLPRTGAHCVVGYPMVKEQFQAEALNDKIYTIIVGKALEADRKTEPTGYNLSPVDKDINVRSKDEPKADGILFKGNLKEGDYKLIKTTNGWVLEGNDIAYCGEPQTERSSE